jgi:hypothetical protein
MTAIEGFNLPTTAHHDEDGNHAPPYISEWRSAADPNSPNYDPDRSVRGSEVERDQRQKAQFQAHLEEHRRRGELAIVTEDIFPS